MSQFLRAVGEVTKERDDVWRPELLAADRRDDRSRLQNLIGSGRVIAVHDQLRQQLETLLSTRSGPRPLGRMQLAVAIDRHLAGARLDDYGTWVFYPWSRRVVHLLPETQFRELLTGVALSEISLDTQDRLGALRIAIAGLSAGRDTAVGLAHRGVGQHFRLADFASLELSDLGRLRGAVHELGINKAVLTAREMFEINPYLEIELFTEGVTPNNFARFLSGPPPRAMADVLFDDWEDLSIKTLLREQARALGIPVHEPAGQEFPPARLRALGLP